MTSRFLIAKYAPDVKRMEPRNIGVILWSGGKTDSLFLGEDYETGSRSVVPRRIGLADKVNYRNWITSWRRQLNKPSLELRSGEIVPRKSPQFLDGLREWSRANFMLVDGGECEAVRSIADLRALTVYLFGELVADEADATLPEREHVQLKAAAVNVWKSVGVWERPDFRKDQPAFFDLYGEKKNFTFDYAVGPSDAPYSVCHRVILGHQKTFDSVLMNLEHYRQYRNLARDRCAAMILPTDGADSRTSRANKKILGHVANVIDLSDVADATQKAGEFAAMNGAP